MTKNSNDKPHSESKQGKIVWTDILPFVLFFFAVLFFVIAVLSTYNSGPGSNGPAMQDTRAAINFDVPAVRLPSLEDDSQMMTIGGARKTPVLVNFFASWCRPCKQEHPHLMKLSEQIDVPFYGIAFTDTAQAASAFLAEDGNPYDQVALDNNAKLAVEFGISGIPATFVLDSTGKIVWRQDGPLKSHLATLKALQEVHK